jgi:hypothetical protein
VFVFSFADLTQSQSEHVLISGVSLAALVKLSIANISPLLPAMQNFFRQ